MSVKEATVRTDRAIAAMDKVFNDTRVPEPEVRKNLLRLKNHADELLAAIPEAVD